MIKFISLNIFLFSLVLSAICFQWFGKESAFSCFFGGLVMQFNFLAISLLWHIVFTKKSILLAVLVIILKYLIVGYILWNLNQIKGLNLSGFILGLSSLLLAILSTLVYKRSSK